jgi:hypothetical protein
LKKTPNLFRQNTVTATRLCFSRQNRAVIIWTALILAARGCKQLRFNIFLAAKKFEQPEAAENNG